jgi:hypothetical protein
VEVFVKNKLLVFCLITQTAFFVHAGIIRKVGYTLGGLGGLAYLNYRLANEYKYRQDPYYADARKQRFNTLLSAYKIVALNEKSGTLEQKKLQSYREKLLEDVMKEAAENYSIPGKCQQAAQNYREAQDILSRIWTSEPATWAEQYPDLAKAKKEAQRTQHWIQEKTGFGR